MILLEYENIHHILAVYYYLFNPGNLKPYTLKYKIELADLKDVLETVTYSEWLHSRRYLPHGEAPFPGYCRAPGSEKCLPVLCNCQKLSEIWKKIKEKDRVKQL